MQANSLIRLSASDVSTVRIEDVFEPCVRGKPIRTLQLAGHIGLSVCNEAENSLTNCYGDMRTLLVPFEIYMPCHFMNANLCHDPSTMPPVFEIFEPMTFVAAVKQRS